MRRLFRMAVYSCVMALSLVAGRTEAQKAGPACERDDQHNAVDVSKPIHRMVTRDGTPVLDALRDDFKIKVIIRYYDHIGDETLNCKRLRADEVDAIQAAGLGVLPVFQHDNDDPWTFINPERARVDALQALEQARINGQPYGTPIYFGVDGVEYQELKNFAWEKVQSKGKPMTQERKNMLKERGWPDRRIQRFSTFYERYLTYSKDFAPVKPDEVLGAKEMPGHIERYFTVIKEEFDRHSGGDPSKGYTAGVYGGGGISAHLVKVGYVTHFWLANAEAWPGYGDAIKRDDWHMLQKLESTCPWRYEGSGPVGADFSTINPKRSDVGAWFSRRANSPSEREAACRP